MSDIIDFSKLTKGVKPSDPKEVKTFLQQAIEGFNKDLNNCESFFAVAFDKDGIPNITYGGEIDFLQLIGTLTVTQAELTDYVRHNFELVEDE